MTIKATLLGVVDYLRTNLSQVTHPLTQVGVRIGGRPPASCGQFYYAVHPQRWSNGTLASSYSVLDYTYGFAITITQRIGYIPDDRLELEAYLKDNEGLADLIDELLCLIHDDRYDLLCSINAQLPIPGNCGSGTYIEPFLFRDMDAEPREMGPAWFSADPNAPDLSKYFGWATTLRFGEGRYIASTTP